jgi:hypothetical protein
MIGQQDALRLFGRAVVDPMGRRVGIVGQLFVDDRTEQPAWITVETGVFGTNVRLVPLDGAAFDGTTLTVAVPRKTVRQAPRVALHQGNLPAEAQQALARHYGHDHGSLPEDARVSGESRGRSHHDVDSFGRIRTRPDGSKARGLKGIIRKLVL